VRKRFRFFFVRLVLDLRHDGKMECVIGVAKSYWIVYGEIVLLVYSRMGFFSVIGK
jgi:hypothetical protein